MRHIFNLSITIITIVALVIFGLTLKKAVIAAPNDEVAMPEATTTAILAKNPTVPARLVIPTLGIDANVQNVGVSVHGTMAVPTNYTDVGWYRYGPIPGNPGKAVMAGHLDNGLSLPGVFKHLADIKIGDEIQVLTKAGDTLRFRVIATSTLDYNTEATQDVFSKSGPAELELITCEGSWDQAHKTYSNRLLVSAVLTSSD